MPAKKSVTADQVREIVNAALADNAKAINESASPVRRASNPTASDVRGMQLADYRDLRDRFITVDDAKVRAQFGGNILDSICVELKMELNHEVCDV